MKFSKQTISTLLLLLTLFVTSSAFGQTRTVDSSNGFLIDPNIKEEVGRYITKSEFGDMSEQTKNLIYNNRMFLDYYDNDKLTISTKDSSEINTVFKSFYYWQHDTLGIDGAFGLFGGAGFSIKLYNGKATLYHMLASDESPSHAYKEKDSLIFRLEVPCTETKIILSEIPDSTKEQMIYGYVEFKSKEYYESEGTVDGKEILPRKKVRADMKIYFRSVSITTMMPEK